MSLPAAGPGRSPGRRPWNTTQINQKGWIAEPKIKDLSVAVTAAGVKKAAELFQKHFQGAGNVGPNPAAP